MLSFRDAAIPNAERNHYAIHEQVSPSYGMATLSQGDEPACAELRILRRHHSARSALA